MTSEDIKHQLIIISIWLFTVTVHASIHLTASSPTACSWLTPNPYTSYYTCIGSLITHKSRLKTVVFVYLCMDLQWLVVAVQYQNGDCWRQWTPAWSNFWRTHRWNLKTCHSRKLWTCLSSAPYCGLHVCVCVCVCVCVRACVCVCVFTRIILYITEIW